MKRLLLILLPLSLFVFSCYSKTLIVDIPTFRYGIGDYIFDEKVEDYVITLRQKDGTNYYLKSFTKGDYQKNFLDQSKIDDPILIDKLLYLCSPNFDTFIYSGTIIEEDGIEKTIKIKNVKGGILRSKKGE